MCFVLLLVYSRAVLSSIPQKRNLLRFKGQEAKRVFRGMPLGHLYLMRGAITPMVTEEKMSKRYY